MCIRDRRYPEVREVLRRRAREAGDLERVRALARESGAAEEAVRRIRERDEAAAQALEALPPSPFREALREIALKEAERVR